MNVKRFIEAQEYDHYLVMNELKQGKKQSCWMWYTFPQIVGLGYSEIAKYFEVRSVKELRSFVNNEYLLNNLTECINAVLKLKTNDAVEVFGPIDARKLQSSMTMFSHTRKLKKPAQAVLDKYFDGESDIRTELRMLSWR